jgi:membrane-associated phospholipid phosphatase
MVPAARMIGLICLAWSVRAAAEQDRVRDREPAVAVVEVHELRNTGALFLGAEFLASVAAFAAFRVTAGDPATQCGWCETNAFDRSVRRALLMEESRPAAVASDVVSLGVSPAVALAGVILPAFSHERDHFALQDSVILLNTFIFTTGITEGTKTVVARQRPAFHYGREGDTTLANQPEEQFLSFYSGHTARAFGFASSAATLAYLRGYWTAPYIAVGGGALAIGTGLLRIAADAHWASDVLVGATAGSALGFAVPFLLHSRRTAHGSIAVLPSISAQHVMLVASGEF